MGVCLISPINYNYFEGWDFLSYTYHNIYDRLGHKLLTDLGGETSVKRQGEANSCMCTCIAIRVNTHTDVEAVLQ